MYEVHVVKKQHSFTLSDIDCQGCAERIAARWRDLGYAAKIVKVS